MAVCNLFSNLTSTSGNFLMFSQYVEDMTRNFSDGDNYKVVPSRFIALDIDYNNIDIPNPTNDEMDLNIAVPKYLQNCFENICAVDKVKPGWTPEISKNIFWNCLYKGKFLSTTTVEEEHKETYNYVNEIMCINDINMHSYNAHQGMGYSEIYCYIPTDKSRQQYKVNLSSDGEYSNNKKEFLEGFYDNNDYRLDLDKYDQSYTRDIQFELNTDPTSIVNLPDNKYNINTIIVLYSIFEKVGDNWNEIYNDIPLGIYFAGLFDNVNKTLTNTIIKHVNTSYDTGTAYGLRICTRMSVIHNSSNIITTDIIADESGYTNLCQLMTAMNENLSKMFDVVKSSINETQQYKEQLSTIYNNRTNVPYIRTINNKDYWFVNGKMVSTHPINTDKN